MKKRCTFCILIQCTNVYNINKENTNVQHMCEKYEKYTYSQCTCTSDHVQHIIIMFTVQFLYMFIIHRFWQYTFLYMYSTHADKDDMFNTTCPTQ